MLKSASFCLLLLSSMALLGQNFNMTFTASGVANKVDSVIATNLRTNECVTLPGQETLILALNTGIITREGESLQGIVYPNPFAGKTTFVLNIPEPQTIFLKVHNLVGQMLTQTQIVLQPGSHSFAISLSRVGVYMISLTTDQGTKGFKVICTETTGAGDRIRYNGTIQGLLFPSLKETTIYTLGYKSGDILLYRCRGGIHTTIITDSPTASANYEVPFALCQDPGGKNYAIVKIGAQTWMAENMAWLPAISDSSKGSDSLKHYYVYDYNGSSVADAKNTNNYKLYGVLYNWPAAMDAEGLQKPVSGKSQAVCPTGWHLPDDGEWKMLEKTLGMSQAEADTIYLRSSGNVGEKLKSSLGWTGDGNGSNSSGFTALPGGYRNTHGSFIYLNYYALFWTSSLSDTSGWYRSLGSGDNGIYRLSTLKSHGFSVRCVKDAN